MPPSSAAEATRYAPGLKLAQRVLVDSTLQTREVVMISDFQRNGWVRDENLRLPEGTTFKPIAITDAQPANLTVSSVLPQRSIFSGQERMTVAAQVINRGPAAASNVQVHLELDGRKVETQLDYRPAQASPPPSRSSHSRWPARSRAARCASETTGSSRTTCFTSSPRRRRGFPCSSSSRRAHRARPACICRRRLRSARRPAFQVNLRQGESISSAELGRHRVVILNDTAALSSGDILKPFVSQGGGLFVIVGERANWGTDSNDLLPGVPGNVIDRPGRGGSLAELDYSHPILEIFKAPRSGNLSTARFFRYRAIGMKPDPPGEKEGEPAPSSTRHRAL